jgi:hypothetical protein
MKTAILIALSIAAAIANLVATGFAQDAAVRSLEGVGEDLSAYSMVGSKVVPFAAEHTSIQFLTASLPAMIAIVSRWRRWPLSISTSLIVTVELLVLAWCWAVHQFAAMPFTHG